ncbi:sod [Ecytonucleospora hepatopenaei]|uniref:Superoxide dismutase n=1 Tax=Ecytonucleospora hepatopenaei TaxID=646526 RepID=A0A1W0E7L3_9MICR|nr:sod [Ecytonucleospora hepatopenaei]
MKEYKLPRLLYDYDKLEPYVDAKTMETHHTKHHNNYVNGLNSTLAGINSGKSLGELVENLMKAKDGYSADVFKNLTLCAGGHFNHTLYFRIMTPNLKTEDSMDESLRLLIEQKFGSISGLKDAFTEKTKKVVGSGWIFLVLPLKEMNVFYEEETLVLTNEETTIKETLKAGELAVIATKNQESPSMYFEQLVPIIAMDIWEHAYYLKHTSDKVSYVNEWFKTLDWEFIGEIYRQTHLGE